MMFQPSGRSMAESGRILPPAAHRFVPTLTEVVHPDAASNAMAPASPPSQVVSPEILEQIVDASILRAESALTEKLPELLAVVLHEHALAVSERLRREIKVVVRESVTTAVTEAARSGSLSAVVSSSPRAAPPGPADDT